jgi:hypothetical protein
MHAIEDFLPIKTLILIIIVTHFMHGSLNIILPSKTPSLARSEAYLRKGFK